MLTQRALLSCLLSLLPLVVVGQSTPQGILSGNPQSSKSIDKAKSSLANGALLSYRPNQGQFADTDGNTRPDIKYVAEGEGLTIYFREKGLSYVFERLEMEEDHGPAKEQLAVPGGSKQQPKGRVRMHRVDIEFAGANPTTTKLEECQQTFFTNYYLAHCPEGITKVPEFSKVTYKGLYPGIDWILYMDEGRLRYDLLVHPEADPSIIEMKITGSEDFAITEEGALKINTPMGSIMEKAPEVYQAGQRLQAGYALQGNRVGFDIEEYNPALPLLIDPTRDWATYYGGSGNDFGEGGCAANGNGDVFIHGHTHSTNFPVSTGAYQGSKVGNSDAFLVKFDSSGNRLWATYYGGSDTETGSGGCAVDGNGDVFIHGYTGSTDFPVLNAYQGIIGGNNDAYLVKFDSNGTRHWATFYGGTDNETGISGCATDASGNVFIQGYTSSTDFPTSPGAYQDSNAGSDDVYLVKFDGNGNRLWATYYGGSGFDLGEGGCAVDGSGDVYIHGHTLSTDFPVSASPFQDSIASTRDAYLVKFNSSGTRQWATYYGGDDYEYGAGGCAVDASGNVFIFGHTGSSDFPVSSGAYQDNNAGGSDAYLVKFDGSGNRQWATFFGGTVDDYSGRGGCAVNGSGDVFIHGHTFSSDLPVPGEAYQDTNGGGRDAYLVQFDGNGNRVWATYYGGSDSDAGVGGCAVDGNEKVYIYGYTSSADFPVSPGAYQGGNAGAQDLYLVKFDVSANLLPINMGYFTGHFESATRSTRLQWATLQESGLDYFLVERSKDGIHFESIGRMTALNRSHTYHFTDSEIPAGSGTTYYRLRIVNLSGEATYSQVISIVVDGDTDLDLLYNPDNAHFRLDSDQKIHFNFRISNLQGQTVQSGVSITNQYQPVKGLSAGLYFLQVQLDGSQSLETHKIWIR